jgi:YesN/AraC family two-component response regulator
MVISDLKMPGLDGMELIRKIKELNPFVRTILMTAFDVDDKIFREYAKNKNYRRFPARAY